MWSVSINRHSEAQPFRFQDLLALQETTLSKLRTTGGSALLFAELAPVITAGRRQIQDGEARTRLELLGIDFVSGERGGNETWHGPGQWTCFVLTPLEAFTGDAMGVRKAVHRILRHTLTVTKQFLPESHLREGAELGVWSTKGKLVSVGIKINSGYITSGFAMNCIPSALAFSGISPCGIDQALPDFLLREIPQNEREGEFLKLPSLIAEIFSNPK
jgi:lipoyl(octanoyl) transferase